MLPRERCLSHGPTTLSLQECLALLLGNGPRGKGALGVARSILEVSGDGLSPPDAERAFFTAMEVAGDAHLSNLPGIGAAAKARLLAAFELGRRYACLRMGPSRAGPQAKKDGSLATAAFARIPETLRGEAQEWLGFVAVYRGGELGNLCVVERGVRTHVNVDPVELFARLLALRPRGFFLFHNHPSGEPLPSPQDIDLTHRVQRLAEHFGIRLQGHGIVTPRGDHWIVV